VSGKPTNTMAIVSLVSGAVGWLGLPVIASVVAIVCGHLARGQIRKTGEDGDLLAIVGLVLGYANVLMVCLGVAFVVVIYGGLFAFLAAAGIASQ
jgi:hypothetical protein